MSYLYVTEQGTQLHTISGQFTITKNNEKIKEIPKETIESISLFGNVQMTTNCIKECLWSGIPVSYFSTKGKYYGRLQSTSHTNIKRQKQQYRLSENHEYTLNFSKRIILAKIKNQATILRRYNRKHNANIDNEIQNIINTEKEIEKGISIPQIMGYEGIASRNYFGAIGKLLPVQFAMKGRTKQPPKDPFNSLISLGYTLLLYELYGLIENKGLSPYAGFMHQDQERHPTLASDLIEEWRSVLVDSTALSLLLGNELKIENFVKDEETGGVYLDKEGMKIFITKYENKLRQEMDYVSADNHSEKTYRNAIWQQVSSLCKSVEEEIAEIYNPVIIR